MGLATRFRELSGWWKLVVVVGVLILMLTIVQAHFVLGGHGSGTDGGKPNPSQLTPGR